MIDELIEDVISTKFEMRKWKLITETCCWIRLFYVCCDCNFLSHLLSSEVETHL
ncbi:hypothetical protein N665_0083s0040 [Sinapis alba]|nr:hypothetical protein N665_0083s0040 [Sinapis alba]